MSSGDHDHGRRSLHPGWTRQRPGTTPCDAGLSGPQFSLWTFSGLWHAACYLQEPEQLHKTAVIVNRSDTGRCQAGYGTSGLALLPCAAAASRTQRPPVLHRQRDSEKAQRCGQSVGCVSPELGRTKLQRRQCCCRSEFGASGVIAGSWRGQLPAAGQHPPPCSVFAAFVDGVEHVPSAVCGEQHMQRHWSVEGRGRCQTAGPAVVADGRALQTCMWHSRASENTSRHSQVL